MGELNSLVPKNPEMDSVVQPPSIDELIERQFDDIVELINHHIEKVYLDFNTAMHGQGQVIAKTETEVTDMVQILWGIVNQANVRSLALETVLLNNGMDKQELEAEIESVSQLYENKLGMQKVNLDDVRSNLSPLQGEDPPPETAQ